MVVTLRLHILHICFFKYPVFMVILRALMGWATFILFGVEWDFTLGLIWGSFW